MLNKNVAVPAITEALIVGGGPAGLAAAIALAPARNRLHRRRGAPGRPSTRPAAKASCPTPARRSPNSASRSPQSDGHPFHGIRFANSVHRVDARFPSGTGIGVRRPHLHALLTVRAEQTGARILWNSHVQLPEAASAPVSTYRTAIVNGQPMRFRWLIGADGQASSVRRWAGLDRARIRSLRFGFRTHYRVAPWSEFVEVHWARGGQLYITPVAPDCVCVVYITRDSRRISTNARTNILAHFPEVAARLAGAEMVSQQRGAVTASCKLRRVATDFVALLGDASGSADAITGEGLAISFRQALALADSIHNGSLQPYRRAHRQIGKLPFAMGELMLTLDRWPNLQVRAIRALASTPIFFRDLLHAHMGEKNLASVLLRRAPRFGWNLLTKGAHA